MIEFIVRRRDNDNEKLKPLDGILRTRLINAMMSRRRVARFQ